jgi:hypothetical protein
MLAETSVAFVDVAEHPAKVPKTSTPKPRQARLKLFHISPLIRFC